MVIAFQIVLIIVILISLCGAIGENDNKKLADNMATICCVSIISLLVTLVWL